MLPPSWDVQRASGSTTWTSSGRTRRPEAGPAVEQELRRVSRQPAGEQLPRGDRTYRPEWTDFGTSCERCHGPGSTHVQRTRRGAERSRTGEPPSSGRRASIRTTSSMMCAQCHSLARRRRSRIHGRRGLLRLLPAGARVRTAQGAGSDLLGRRPPAPVLERRDGPVAERVLPARWRDVHDVPSIAHLPTSIVTHSWRRPTTPCARRVTSRSASALAAHTRHKADSAGSSCVECHMPKTVVSIKATIRDHTIGVPAPENTVAFGIPNACTECHTDKGRLVGVGDGGEGAARWTARWSNWPRRSPPRARTAQALPSPLVIAGERRAGVLIDQRRTWRPCEPTRHGRAQSDADRGPWRRVLSCPRWLCPAAPGRAGKRRSAGAGLFAPSRTNSALVSLVNLGAPPPAHSRPLRARQREIV